MQSNELEFQGRVIVWLNEVVGHLGSQLEMATQEKPRPTTGQRNDLVVWSSRAAEVAFLAIELKTPTTPLNDPAFMQDALEKAQHWQAPYFALWNMRQLELYATPPVGQSPIPTDAITRSTLPLSIANVDDWLKPNFAKALRNHAQQILRAAIDHSNTGEATRHPIDSEIFVKRLTATTRRVRSLLHTAFASAAGNSRALRKQLNLHAAKQGFKGFVEDITLAVAGQVSYRFVGQILFFFALKRQLPTLKELQISPNDPLPDAFQPYWNEVRRYDYEALFKPDPLESAIEIPQEAVKLLADLISQLSIYDWASLSGDVLGSIFEQLIPDEEKTLLGQFYTPRGVADLLAALTIDGERPMVLDPGCGSGTFLMSVYSYLAHRALLTHQDLLQLLWGFDISPFAAELATINIYRQDMSVFDNFPRIVSGNFFERSPGQTLHFPAPRASTKPQKILTAIPTFDCVVGNPPYLRSQNQDDLNPEYRQQLFSVAAKAGVKASAKTDLFVFFVYHSLGFLRPGGRLGFVTPASWLTADYAGPLQRILLTELRLRAVLASSAESFFPQVDVNTVLIVAERSKGVADDRPIQFTALKKPIAQLIAGAGPYWDRIAAFLDEIEAVESSIENDRYRVKCASAELELSTLNQSIAPSLNWSRYLRAPLSYYEIFGDHP